MPYRSQGMNPFGVGAGAPAPQARPQVPVQRGVPGGVNPLAAQFTRQVGPGLGESYGAMGAPRPMPVGTPQGMTAPQRPMVPPQGMVPPQRPMVPPQGMVPPQRPVLPPQGMVPPQRPVLPPQAMRGPVPVPPQAGGPAINPQAAAILAALRARGY